VKSKVDYGKNKKKEKKRKEKKRKRHDIITII